MDGKGGMSYGMGQSYSNSLLMALTSTFQLLAGLCKVSTAAATRAKNVMKKEASLSYSPSIYMLPPKSLVRAYLADGTPHRDGCPSENQQASARCMPAKLRV